SLGPAASVSSPFDFAFSDAVEDSAPIFLRLVGGLLERAPRPIVAATLHSRGGNLRSVSSPARPHDFCRPYIYSGTAAVLWDTQNLGHHCQKSSRFCQNRGSRRVRRMSAVPDSSRNFCTAAKGRQGQNPSLQWPRSPIRPQF